MELNDIIACSIAFLAVLLTFLTIVIQKKHYRLSVKPIGAIYFTDYEEKVNVIIRNNGIGPLLFTSFKVYDKKNNMVSKPAIIDLMPSLPDNIQWSHFNKSIDGWSLLPGHSIVLIELSGDPKDSNYSDYEKSRERVRGKLKDLRVQFYYQCIYKKEQWLCTRDLDFFGRHTPPITV